MNQSVEWYENVPPLAENRVRYIAVLTVLVIIMLAAAARPYEAAAPTNRFFTSTGPRPTLSTGIQTSSPVFTTEDSVTSGDTRANEYSNDDNAGYSEVTQSGKRYKSKFNRQTLSYSEIDEPSSGIPLDPDSKLGAAPLINPNPLGGFTDSITDNSDISLVTFDNLLASTGLRRPGNLQTKVPVDSVRLPESLAELLKVMGDYEDSRKTGILRAIARSNTYDSKARAMAISGLGRFGPNKDTSNVLNKIVRDEHESFALREIALNTLVDIDGVAFERFFIESCKTHMQKESDSLLGQLLTLAAYRDVELYDGRSLRKVLPELEPYKDESSMVNGLTSIKLRLKDYNAPHSELKKYLSSRDVVVLSSLVSYLARHAHSSDFAKSLLAQAATETINPNIRNLAKEALRTVRAN